MPTTQSATDQSPVDLLGTPEIPKEGRGRLIGIAVNLFYYHGFNAIGIDRIIAEAGVSKTTFYKHFQSKTELMVAAVKWRDEWEFNAWNKAMDLLAGDCPRRKLRAFFDILDWWFNHPDFRGCIFIHAATEFPNPNDPVHKAAIAHKQANLKLIRELAVQAGALEPDAFADAYATLIEGTLVMRHAYARDDAAKAALPAADALLNQYLPAA